MSRLLFVKVLQPSQDAPWDEERMKSHHLFTIVACAILQSSFSAAAEGQNAALSSCIDAGFSELIAEKSQDYASDQFYLVCQYKDPEKRERSKFFSYSPPEGFKIVSATADVVLKSAQAHFRDLAFEQQQATVNLHCKGRPDADHVHDAIAVNIVGRLEYLPTAQDAKDIAGQCLSRILAR